MSEQVVKSSELSNYEFGDPVAPEGFDPEAKGFTDMPPGWHKFVIPSAEADGFSIKENHLFKNSKEGDWTGNQIRPNLTIVEGQPFAGATKMDFLPLPTIGRPMPKHLANQWANFLRSLGFTVPVDKLIPAGFKLSMIHGRSGWVHIVEDEYDGKKKIKVAYYGYRPLNDPPPPSSGAPAAAAGGLEKKAKAAAATAQPPAAVNIDDI